MDCPTYSNLIKQVIPTRPIQIWVGDITCISIWTNKNEYRFCYLSMILDTYIEEVYGRNASITLETKYPM